MILFEVGRRQLPARCPGVRCGALGDREVVPSPDWGHHAAVPTAAWRRSSQVSRQSVCGVKVADGDRAARCESADFGRFGDGGELQGLAAQAADPDVEGQAVAWSGDQVALVPPPARMTGLALTSDTQPPAPFGTVQL